jgi:aspartokinase-like uncharacterized kinase
MTRRIVAKVGGSLFDLPDLRERLQRWMASVSPAAVLFLPGGGDLADAIRTLHHTHRLPEETSHWLAIRTMSVNAHFLGALLGLPVVSSGEEWTGNVVLDALPFFTADEGRPGSLPHSWKVTSDSLAARVAQFAGAELALLKSAEKPESDDWEKMAQADFVDRYFPPMACRVPRVTCVNLRAKR